MAQRNYREEHQHDANLDTIRIDTSRQFLDKVVDALKNAGAAVNVNLRSNRDGNPDKAYGNITICFPPDN